MSSPTEQAKDQPQMAEGSGTGNNPTGSIDFRGHVTQVNKAAEYPILYRKGWKVWLKRARGLDGPYVIDAVYTDGTYRLTDGQVVQDGVKEEALKPISQ